MSKTSDQQIKELLKLILTSSEDAQKKIINKLSPSDLKRLRTAMNPTKKPVAYETDEYIAMHYVDVDKQYKQKFLMTGMIGFLYRMLDEYTPPHIEEQELKSEEAPEFANLVNTKILEFRDKKPEIVYENHYNEAVKKGNILDQYKYRLFRLRHSKNLLRNSIRRTRDAKINLESRKATDEPTYKGSVSLSEEMEKRYAAKLHYENTGEGTLSAGDLAKTIEQFKTGYDSINARTAELAKKFAEVVESLEYNTKEYDRLVDAEKVLKTQISDLKMDFFNDRSVHETLVLNSGDSETDTKKPMQILLVQKWKSWKLDPKVAEITDEEYENIVQDVKKTLGIETTKEEKMDEWKDQMEGFLNSLFKYNPDNHVRCAYYPNYNKKMIRDVKTVQDRTQWEDDVKKHRDEVEKKYERTVIPPQDSFFRLNRYIDNNYESLRQATDDIYDVTPGSEHAFAPLKFFKGTPEDVEKKFQKFKEMYNDEFDLDVFLLNLGNWTMVDSWEANREKIDFYSEKTEIVKRIIDRSKQDARDGKKLMEKRIAKGSKNVERDEDFEHYLDAKPNKIDKYGAVRAKSDSTDSDHQFAVANDSKVSDDKNEIELAIHHIAPVARKGRRFRANMEKYTVNLDAEAPNTDTTGVMSAGQYHKYKDEKKGKKKAK